MIHRHCVVWLDDRKDSRKKRHQGETEASPTVFCQAFLKDTHRFEVYLHTPHFSIAGACQPIN